VKSDLANLGMQILSLGGYIGILLLLVGLMMKGEIGAGAFAAVFASVELMFSMMKGFFERVGILAGNFGKVQNYIRFMQTPERSGEDIEFLEDIDIVLSGVCFSYPGAKQKTVDGVSAVIQNGETIAVVGENGSGKTTLVRLITGLYLPDEGDVLYNQVNTKTVSARSLFGHFSAVFQQYQRYQMTLRENVGISEVNKAASDFALDNVCSLASAGKDRSSFTNGYDTMLSREFDGVDLSGGEWQRVAIARGFFRSRQIIVLDEPTAAIDPIEETKIYGRFAEISQNKTALIVTHRLGSAKFADRILVMKQGRLVEQGTHDNLLKAGGEYARLYGSQKQWYN
jgi:ATP-binding cassette subfamily B protein